MGVASHGNDGLEIAIGKLHHLAGWRGVAALATEIEKQAAQAVEDRLALVDLDAAQDMRPGAHDRIGAGIDGCVKQLGSKLAGRGSSPDAASLAQCSIIGS